MNDNKLKKWRIFGYQTNIEWYDVKTKIKQLLRKIFYNFLMQEVLAWLIMLYIELVFLTSRKKILNNKIINDSINVRSPLIIAFWHNRLVMIPAMAKRIKNSYPNYNFMTLASRHGDGRIVGRVMQKFGLISILGSTKDGRKSSRGIDFSSMRQILDGLKRGYSLGITPDGPRGPNQKINGDIINIARIANAKIIAVSYSSSNFIIFNSWDRFKLPLPFGKLSFYIDEVPIEIPRNSSDEQIIEFEKTLTNKLNFAQNKADEIIENFR
jgi:lysophospholipid acyltransferase (LPLAT)-like uncharacterized protein